MWSTVDKPPGIPVFPPHHGVVGTSVAARVLASDPARGSTPWPPGFDAGICHRLDTATSGALLLAADPEALAEARRQFREGSIRKTYRLVASVVPDWEENWCERSIAHHPRRSSRMVVERGPSTAHRGRWYPAVTRFRRLGGALLEAEMVTGVTHQIRVHAAFLGIPLAGDRLYGGVPRPDLPAAAQFLLHHVGLVGSGGLRTEPVAWPVWAR